MDDTTATAMPGEKEADNLPVSLRALADALVRASTVEQVADALVRQGLPALNACVAVLAVLDDDGTRFYSPRIAGYPEEVADAWRHFSPDAPVPIAEAVRQNRPVFLETLEQRLAYYPAGMRLPAQVGRALAAVPMRRGKVVGGLGFTFPADRSFDESQRTALQVVAELCADALEKVRRGGLGCEVLVADDEPGVLQMLDFALRYHAFTVRCAAGGEAAICAYQRHQSTVDVVLLDVQMPGLDGPQTLAELRRIDPAVRCVFMSGNVGGYTAEELLNLGAVRIVAKPFASLDGLMRVLREVARRAAASSRQHLQDPGGNASGVPASCG